MQKGVGVAWKKAVISCKTFGFELDEFCNSIFLVFQEIPCLFSFGLAMEFFILDLPEGDDLLEDQSNKIRSPIGCFVNCLACLDVTLKLFPFL